MQNSVYVNSSTIFSYVIFYTKNVLSEATFAVKTGEKDHAPSLRLAKERRKTTKNHCWALLLLIETTLVLNNLKGKL